MHVLPHNRNQRFQIFLVIVFLLCLNAAAFAGEYGFDTWTTANGLPQNTVTGVAQTPDGYLWLSTFDGLVRFDGVRFTIFDKGNTKGIVNNRFTRLFVDPDGTVWAATDNNVITAYRKGVFTSYSQLAQSQEPNSQIFIIADKDGNALFETEKALYSFQNAQFVPSLDKSERGITRVFFGKSGAKWIFERNQISQVKDGQNTNYKINLEADELNYAASIVTFEDSEGLYGYTITIKQ